MFNVRESLSKRRQKGTDGVSFPHYLASVALIEVRRFAAICNLRKP
jgi:hypothetical protein